MSEIFLFLTLSFLLYSSFSITVNYALFIALPDFVDELSNKFRNINDHVHM